MSDLHSEIQAQIDSLKPGEATILPGSIQLNDGRNCQILAVNPKKPQPSMVELNGCLDAIEVTHQHEGKWWFWNETWSDRYGPYESKEEASKALFEYAKNL